MVCTRYTGHGSKKRNSTSRRVTALRFTAHVTRDAHSAHAHMGMHMQPKSYMTCDLQEQATQTTWVVVDCTATGRVPGTESKMPVMLCSERERMGKAVGTVESVGHCPLSR